MTAVSRVLSCALLLTISATLATPTQAQTEPFEQIGFIGTGSLQLPTSTRSLGMGGTGRADATDPFNSVWNPSMLALRHDTAGTQIEIPDLEFGIRLAIDPGQPNVLQVESAESTPQRRRGRIRRGIG